GNAPVSAENTSSASGPLAAERTRKPPEPRMAVTRERTGSSSSTTRMSAPDGRTAGRGRRPGSGGQDGTGLPTTFSSTSGATHRGGRRVVRGRAAVPHGPHVGGGIGFHN